VGTSNLFCVGSNGQGINELLMLSSDYNGAWDLTSTGMNAPLYGDPADPRPTRNTWNVAATVNGYLQAGLSRVIKAQPTRNECGIVPNFDCLKFILLTAKFQRQNVKTLCKCIFMQIASCPVAR